MADRANISSGYLWRLGLVSLFCFALAGWCIYDALVTYPFQNERWQKFDELKEADRLADWDSIARENDWPLEAPSEEKTEGDIAVQYLMASLVAPIGLLFAVFFILARGRWLEATEDGLNTSWGRRCQFHKVKTLNKTQWKHKGIAKIYYDDDGRERRIVLDDCKYDPDVTEALLRLVESYIDDDQIVGGRRQPPLEGEEIVDEEEYDAAAEQDVN